MLESEFNGQAATMKSADPGQEKLRRNLTELVKECESYKRELMGKGKEVERLQEQLKQAQQKMAKTTQKVEMMKKKISLRDLENLTTHEKGFKVGSSEPYKNDPTTILQRNDLYDTLDFRINSLRNEYAELIHDLQE